MGDIWTLTVREYLESSRWKRFACQLARNPVVLFGIAPLYTFLIKHRFSKAGANQRERHSVYWTNLMLVWVATQVFTTLICATNRAWSTEVYNWWRLPLKSLALLGIMTSALLLGLAAPILPR